MSKEAQRNQMKSGKGFVAALDQSGGSTPQSPEAYGVIDDAYGSEAEMFDSYPRHAVAHRQRSAFTGDKVVGAILFEMTMDRQMGGKPSATYLWEERGVVPFLKVDKGLADEANGVR